MKKVYDIFAEEYIDESEKSPYAPPERYIEIAEADTPQTDCERGRAV